MTDAEALEHALTIAGDCMEVASSALLDVRYRGLGAAERRQIEAHLERISTELDERARTARVQQGERAESRVQDP